MIQFATVALYLIWEKQYVFGFSNQAIYTKLHRLATSIGCEKETLLLFVIIFTFEAVIQNGAVRLCRSAGYTCTTFLLFACIRRFSRHVLWCLVNFIETAVHTSDIFSISTKICDRMCFAENNTDINGHENVNLKLISFYNFFSNGLH